MGPAPQLGVVLHSGLFSSPNTARGRGRSTHGAAAAGDLPLVQDLCHHNHIIPQLLCALQFPQASLQAWWERCVPPSSAQPSSASSSSPPRGWLQFPTAQSSPGSVSITCSALEGNTTQRKFQIIKIRLVWRQGLLHP